MKGSSNLNCLLQASLKSVGDRVKEESDLEGESELLYGGLTLVSPGPIVDTVVMNPLFGTGKKGADMDFLFATLKAEGYVLKLADVIPGEVESISGSCLALLSTFVVVLMEATGLEMTRNATGLVAPAIVTGLGALTHTLGTLVPVIEASGFAASATTTVIGTVVSSFR
ncbi:hypothetical protein TEA_018068 [Camellia sinensis var. sinensis]|uniref:Uncharacterized protein n=1 Tax=Camellia sinensis var. sinensis TaxID=542762 RepID=A0A4S4DGP5_CAMSN|nr:hypothetical protein TEA_018068 [Camellia sinensis var. sinensis]